MNAPATQLINAQQRLALDLLVPSKTNPRSRRGFDEASLNELAASIKSADVLQPILVRPLVAQPVVRPSASWPFPEPAGYAKVKEQTKPAAATHYEIVAGERRWRAARIAGTADVPVVIRELTDLEVLRIQLIENVQRKDLDALEEAEGYEKLMQQKDVAGSPYTAELIAKLMGVSKATVYARLKLTALCQDARDAFCDGKIDASTALLIARIPVEKLQLQALKKVTEEAGWSNQFITTGDKMSFRRAREILQQEFMLDLDRAAFDTKDAALLPKAGDCTACPKRTGNAPDLFDDVGSKDVCTDPVCFGMKKAAHVLRLQKQAEDQGGTVIKGKEAKKLIPNNRSTAEHHLKEHGYATLDTLVPGDAKKRTLGQLLEENKLLAQDKATGKPAVQKTVVANPYREGQMIETVNIEQAAKALREMGYEITLKGKQPQPTTQVDEKQLAKEKAQLDIENKYRARLFSTLRQQIEADMSGPKAFVTPGLYCLLAERAFDALYDDQAGIARLYWPDSGIEEDADLVEAFQKKIPALTTQQHFLILIDMLLIDETSTNTWAVKQGSKPETMLRVANEIGIDADALKQEIAAEAKAAAKAAAKPAKTIPTPAQAAQAPDSGAPEKTEAAWPFPEPGYTKVTPEKAKRKAAAAA